MAESELWARIDETERRNLADKDRAEIFCTHGLIWINSLEILAPRLIVIESFVPQKGGKTQFSYWFNSSEFISVAQQL